jgi:hypothetical protein
MQTNWFLFSWINPHFIYMVLVTRIRKRTMTYHNKMNLKLNPNLHKYDLNEHIEKWTIIYDFNHWMNIEIMMSKFHPWMTNLLMMDQLNIDWIVNLITYVIWFKLGWSWLPDVIHDNPIRSICLCRPPSFHDVLASMPCTLCWFKKHELLPYRALEGPWFLKFLIYALWSLSRLIVRCDLQHMRLVLVVALGGDGDGRVITITLNLQVRFWALENMAQEANTIFEPLTTDGSCGSRLWKDLPWTIISSGIIMNSRLKHGMHFGHQIFRVYSQKIYTSWSFCQAWVAICNWVMNCRISAVSCIYKSMHSNVIYWNRSSTE